VLIPWLLALVTAVWFGFSAHKAQKYVFSWALAGAVFGLLTATFVFGLAHATAIPYSDHQRSVDKIEWSAIAIGLIALLGWVLTSALRPNGLRFWKKRDTQAPPPPTPAPQKPQPPRPPSKR
jgi:hypothetical protein